MKPENPYAVPKSDLSSLENGEQKQITFFRKFLHGLCFSLVALSLIVVATLSKDQWFLGGIGAVVFAFLAGVIAGLVPTQKKFIYLPLSFTVIVVALYFIGASQV